MMLILGQKQINTDGNVDIWSGQVYRPMSEPSQCIIRSTSDLDASDGAGCQVASISGLIAWDQPEVTEYVELNGTRPASTSGRFVAVNAVHCERFGSLATNAGRLTVISSVDGVHQAAVSTATGRSTDAVYSIPEGQQLTITSAQVTLKASSPQYRADVSMMVQRRPEGSTGGWQLLAWVNDSLSVTVAGPASIKAVCDYISQPMGICCVTITGELGNANEG